MGSEGPKVVTFHVTGFKKFHGVSENPTETIATNLTDYVTKVGLPAGVKLGSCTVLETAGEGARPALYKIFEAAASNANDEYIVWLHLGVNSGAQMFDIERQAYNEATFRCPDEFGWQPQQETIVATDGDISKTKQVMAEKRKQVLVPTQPKKRGYISWNSQMDALLNSVLYNQVSQGNNGDGDWKPQAYQAVVDEVRSKLNVSVTTENVRNRVKIWRRHYGTIMEIRTKTKFKWDEERKMVLVPRDDQDEWDTYIKVNPAASSYANKYIEHWDDILILLGPDRAVGEGGEHYEEGTTMMDEEACDGSTSSIDTTSTSSKKKRKSDSLADGCGYSNSLTHSNLMLKLDLKQLQLWEEKIYLMRFPKLLASSVLKFYKP
ncbi:uncharacterized protein LOC141633594 isoform X1 [Silene latifolia]|uniref:uncharacterized protein LOC141633594 isoform X1 n=1 Tax=Silene latifolia TaxID=37657 RepID=UPI003D7780A2